MPTPTYTALANITLGSSASSVTFSSIPATFRDLVLVSAGKATGSGSGAKMRVNGDSGSNYPIVRMYGWTGGVGSDGGTGALWDIAAMNTADGFQAVVQFMDYSATDKHKTILIRSQESGLSATLANAGRWSNTAAINTIEVFTQTAQFAAGTTFALYGIAS